MWKRPTGEPYAGEPHVRFGGRGESPYPYQEIQLNIWLRRPLIKLVPKGTVVLIEVSLRHTIKQNE
ncbi:hypothetical protein C2869_07215 [Saccharobesus litoralis]|uniref:Uncharacterized protein n=1 Tax=Saccharobesus litoralis TaxID=2172099 RepID=A0A2S0VPU2_9ALTE|nr:hypothetical protein C2869_07215 [Saccharobesus litoralis]